MGEYLLKKNKKRVTHIVISSIEPEFDRLKLPSTIGTPGTGSRGPERKCREADTGGTCF